MFIKKITINNFRGFPLADEKDAFTIENLNTPNGKEGSGLTVLVGENGVGKSTILEALALSMVQSMAENFGIGNFCAAKEPIKITTHADKNFNVHGNFHNYNTLVMNGFFFEAYLAESARIAHYHKFLNAGGEYNDKNQVDVIRDNQKVKFRENIVLFLDRNRMSGVFAGTAALTIETLNSQYLKIIGRGWLDLDKSLDGYFAKVDVEDAFRSAMKDFHYMKTHTHDTANEEMPDNLVSEETQFVYHVMSKMLVVPNFNSAKDVLICEVDGKNPIPLSDLGSGYGIIFPLLYFYYLAKQSERDVILIIDEPELHLHPMLQKYLVDSLLRFSKDVQVVIASHSPLLVKQLLQSSKVNDDCIRVLEKNDEGDIAEIKIKGKISSRLSANEINYVAFNLATEEYHSELYESLNAKWREKDSSRGHGLQEFDRDYFVYEKGESNLFPWKKKPNIVSAHTFIRNQIHHRANNGAPDYEALKFSIDKMRDFWLEDYPDQK